MNNHSRIQAKFKQQLAGMRLSAHNKVAKFNITKEVRVHTRKQLINRILQGSEDRRSNI